MDTLLSIIVVEDHDALREVTVEALREKGHHVIGVDCAEALVEIENAINVDLMLIDLNLPGEDGISLTRRIRICHPDVGIIMVTARGKIAEKLEGYESGADIYLTKPTTVEELHAAIQALSRRLIPVVQTTSDLKLDLTKLILSGVEGDVALTSHEANLLAAFALAPGRRLENWQLIKLLGKNETDYSKSSLEVQIVRLRKKLLQVGVDNQPIKAIRQIGYQLCTKVKID